MQGNLQWYEGVKRRVQRWTWAFFVLSLCASFLWVFKVRTTSQYFDQLIWR